MTRLKQQVKVDLVSWYKSMISTQRAYRRKYGTKTAPDPKIIRNFVKNFEENGSVCEKKRFGPKLTVRTPQTGNNYQKWRMDRTHNE